MKKYIFDFDDVLFRNTEKFKEHMYMCLRDAGIGNKTAKKYYNIERRKGFVLKNLINSIVLQEKMTGLNKEELSEKIMSSCKEFINTELVEIVRELGKNNCYIVTHGITEYQTEKIKRAGISDLFCKIEVVSDSKKEKVEAICEEFRDHEVVFIDDKSERFADLDSEKYPNLRTILYLGKESLKKIKKELFL